MHRQTDSVADELSKVRPRGGLGEYDQLVVGPDRACAHAMTFEQVLDALGVDSHPGDLQESASPADDLVQAIEPSAAKVARPQLGERPTARQVLGALRVAQHDDRAGVDELAHAVVALRKVL